MDVFLCVLSNSKRFLKNFEIWPIFGRKSAIFCIFRVAILVPRFLRKPLKLPQKCFKWLDFWYTDSLGCMQQSYVWDFENFDFSLNYDPFFVPRRHFFAKNDQNLRKNVVLAKKMGYNSVKIQNFRNPKRNFVACTLGSLYTKNQVIWKIFEEV